MKRAMLFIIVAVCLWASTGASQPMQADLPTEVIGHMCKTMEQHPAPTTEAPSHLLDYAVCGPGGLRVYPSSAVAPDFLKIDLGVQGQTPGRDLVYLSGYMKTIVMPAFDGRARFRHSWLNVDTIRRGMSFATAPKVARASGGYRVSVDIKNPLTKPITGTDVVLTLQGSQYIEPLIRSVPVLNPGETQTVSFDVSTNNGPPKGRLLIKNYGRVYIDIEEAL
jgi:hypothetical protein